jgi:hypothetical protein
MISRNFLHPLRYLLALLITCGVGCPTMLAQELLPDTPQPASDAVQPATMPAPPNIAIAEHKFWDKENIALFAASAAMSAADFTVTRQNLQSGGRELNPIVRIYGRSTAGLALNFSSETLGGIGLSYIFHRSGHHRLERAVSMFNIGTSIGAVTYSATHR